MDLHTKLKYRIVSEILIETLEDIRIGGEKDTFEPSSVDLPIVKDLNGNPYLPGSSLKGVIKSHIERIINSLDVKSDILKKYNITKTKIGEHEFQKKYNEVEGNLEKIEDMFNKMGSIGHLFGKSGYASALKFADAYPEGNVHIEKRTHVAIDINTGKAKSHALINLEFVPKGYTFKGKIIFDELDDELVSGANILHLLILKMLQNGLEIHIGGWKSRGYGLSKISISKIQVYTPQKLILSEAPEVYENENIEKYIEKRLNDYGGQ